MGCCKKKNCEAKKHPLTCIVYSGVIPDWSSLSKKEHVSVEDIVEDLYKEVVRLKTNLSFESLGSKCLQYTVSKNLLSVSDIAKMIENKICG